MIRLEEFQVKAYSEGVPERSMEELVAYLEENVNGAVLMGDAEKEEAACVLRDMLVYVSKYADAIGYTLSEVAER